MARDGFMVSRSIFDHDVFRQKRKFSRLEAWVWMLAEAAWKPRKVDVSGQSVLIERGQFCHSLRFIGTAWGWEKDAVARFMTRLKSETMIETHTETGQMVITICNYDEYQLTPAADRDSTATASETRPRQHRDSTATNENQDNQVINKSAEDTSLRSVAPAAPKPTAKTELMIVLDAEHAQDVIDHRNKIKKPMTPKAAKMLAGKLGTFDDPNRAADFMIEKGWQSIERDWVDNAMSQQRQAQPVKPSPGDMFAKLEDFYRAQPEREGADSEAAQPAIQDMAKLAHHRT